MPNLRYRTVEEAWPGFNHQRFDAEVRREALRLQALLGIVSREHLLSESAVALANVNRGVALVANDRGPRDVLCLQADCFPRGDASNGAQGVKRQIFILPKANHHEPLRRN